MHSLRFVQFKLEVFFFALDLSLSLLERNSLLVVFAALFASLRLFLLGFRFALCQIVLEVVELEFARLELLFGLVERRNALANLRLELFDFDLLLGERSFRELQLVLAVLQILLALLAIFFAQFNSFFTLLQNSITSFALYI